MIYRLFVYGTLLQAGNEFAAYLTANSTYLQTGKVRGELYDIGDYPGLILSEIDQYVYGSLYEVNHETLKLIDDYEGYGNEQEQPNLYVRKLLHVETDWGLVNAWAYLYNRPVKDLPVIRSGDYLKYMAQKKSPGL